jgi:hypothetical protein
MFCPHCGKEVKVVSRYCRWCGAATELSPEFVGASRSMPDERTDSAVYNRELEGVWGWLLFFCLWLVLLSPALVLISGPGRLLLFNVISRLLVVFGVLVGTSLWSRYKHALGLLRIYFLVVFVGRLLWFVVIATTSLRVGKNPFVEIVTNFVGFGLLLLWIAYFHVSERVRATYGDNLRMFSV